MPLLEAPTEYLETSPDHSLQAELPILLAAPGPAALAQLRIPPAEVRLNNLHQQQQQQQHQPFAAVAAQLQQTPQRNNRRLILGRRNSFDRDVPIVEETQHFPAFVHLLPVVLPTQAPEPTLDELLRRVTQRTDLDQVETVRLRVISYTISLSRLSLFMPRLQHLDLSGSVLSSLRDLGYGLLQLKHLNISNCGLNSFDGTSGLPGLRVLIADGNMIQRVGPLAELAELQVLKACHNRISELGLLSFLGLCPQLREVELLGNPVCRLPLYRATLRRSVPSLQMLDGQSFNVAQANEQPAAEHSIFSPSNEEAQSSLSSEASSSSESIATRPATAPQNHNNNYPLLDTPLRPTSALVSLNVGHRQQQLSAINSTPVAGSVLGLVRQRRRRSGHAWVSSSSSGSSSNASSVMSTRAPSMSSCSSNSSLDLHSANYSFNPRTTLD
ncbi:uncharacterized protein [Drosophila tropicalis]|uniref:uncharacterized protein n=1 Tax=Drosophila tropicalis TaxID=46794 RepID=UPI0035ABA0E2